RKLALHQASTPKDALNNSGRPITKSYNGDYCKRAVNKQISSRWWEDESDEHYDKPVPEE
ncbi:hypothetical protein A2U01_0109387, partial [Trifolium medium]|nr:hypothetical protein [Trifolium medium]